MYTLGEMILKRPHRSSIIGEKKKIQGNAGECYTTELLWTVKYWTTSYTNGFHTAIRGLKMTMNE